MDENFTDLLHAKYPNLFKVDLTRPKASARVHCQCHSGWHSIIDAVCAVINDYVENKSPDPANMFKWTQIKEKFGGLRLYYEGPDSEFIRGVIRVAEAVSRKTCEMCSRPGTLQPGRWLRTLCPDCATSVDKLV